MVEFQLGFVHVVVDVYSGAVSFFVYVCCADVCSFSVLVLFFFLCGGKFYDNLRGTCWSVRFVLR